MPRLQRAQGQAAISVAQVNGRTRLNALVQQGCTKLFLPRVPGPIPEAVLLNTSGGLTGGDYIRYGANVGDGASLLMTTQAAERLYRSTGEVAVVETQLSLAAGARLRWLPQETIFFDGASLRRHLRIDMAGDAELLALEMLVLGRRAHGETVNSGLLSDRWTVRRDGRLILAEALRLKGAIAETLQQPATAGGAQAMATLVFVAPDAEDRLAAARAILDEMSLNGVQAAASAWDGLMVVRWLALEGWTLRRAIAAYLTAFTAFALPRVWAL